MTPNVPPEVMASRPLWDPDPETFVAQAAVGSQDLRRVKLSDFVVMALEINRLEKRLSKAEIDVFESVYVRGANVRSSRKHEGRPALAPDGTVMSMREVAYIGNGEHQAELGHWTPLTVKECEGYKEWLARIVQTQEDLRKRGIDLAQTNAPLPDKEALAEANAYVPKPTKKAVGQKSTKSEEKGEPSKGKGRERLDEATPEPPGTNSMLDTSVNSVRQVMAHVQGTITAQEDQEAWLTLLRARLQLEFADDAEKIQLNQEILDAMFALNPQLSPDKTKSATNQTGRKEGGSPEKAGGSSRKRKVEGGEDTHAAKRRSARTQGTGEQAAAAGSGRGGASKLASRKKSGRSAQKATDEDNPASGASEGAEDLESSN